MREPSALPPPRCNTDERRRIIKAALELGVPRDYAARRGMRVVREPHDLAFIGMDIHDRPQWMEKKAARAWLGMQEAARRDGIELQVVSAFRSASYQLTILQRKLDRGLSIDEILKVSAAPGYSEHHSGRVVDLTTPSFPALEEAFENSPAHAWLLANAGRFGFRQSFPRNNRHGIAFEPWHWCWHRN